MPHFPFFGGVRDSSRTLVKWGYILNFCFNSRCTLWFKWAVNLLPLRSFAPVLPWPSFPHFVILLPICILYFSFYISICQNNFFFLASSIIHLHTSPSVYPPFSSTRLLLFFIFYVLRHFNHRSFHSPTYSSLRSASFFLSTFPYLYSLYISHPLHQPLLSCRSSCQSTKLGCLVEWTLDFNPS